MRHQSSENFFLVFIHKHQENEGVIFTGDKVNLPCSYLRSVYNNNWLEMAPNIVSDSTKVRLLGLGEETDGVREACSNLR